MISGRPTARAPRTLQLRRATWASYLRWTLGRGADPEDVRSARDYLASLLDRGLAPTTVLDACSHLSVGLSLARPCPVTERALADARSSLSRLLPYHVARQAAPAEAKHVRALEDADPLEKGMLARLLWHGAARYSDWVGRLPCHSVRTPFGGWVVVNYRLTKTSQRGAARLAAFRLPSRTWERLRARLQARPQGEAVFHIPYATFARWVGRVCPGLTAHSFRRGAVQRMLDGGIAPAALQTLTGHRTRRTLYAYADRVPEPALREMAKAARVMGVDQ